MPRLSWTPPRKPVNHLAAVLREYKRASGLTSDEIGAKLGCSGENVRCQIGKPAAAWNIGKLLQYCDVLGIPYDVALQAAARQGRG